MQGPSVHSLLKKYSIRAKKRYGQHFLSAAPTIKKIVSASGITGNDIAVEIGPGLGNMTREVATVARRVIAIEKDPEMLSIAGCELLGLKNVQLIGGDILQCDLAEVIGKGNKAKVIGNLPYYISSQIIFWLIENRRLIETATVMLQKEVAMRLVASPRSKDYGIITVILSAYAKTKKLFDVSAKSFTPPPDVESSVVACDFLKCRADIQDEGLFAKVVKAAFGRRRKFLKNSILGAPLLDIDRTAIEAALKAMSLDGKVRAEELPVDTFVALANSVGAMLRRA
jgi:16S rRNA (adenine1518-N6/adenine1519-N6)-dimethyltransferase